MILSVSRRTDIPNYYSQWFYNRIKEGFALVRNPLNPHQISRIDLSPEVVDCIVFWTKNPKPMLDRLEELTAYNYYFQFTLTGYGKDIEYNIPHKKETMIPIFQELSQKVGSKQVIWRYDPILFTPQYTPEYHLKAFTQIAEALKGYTYKCVISFVDDYAKIRKNMKTLGVYHLNEPMLLEFAKEIGKIAKANGMAVGSCAEAINLEKCGIEHSSCIDKKLIEDIVGCKINVKKDKNQRPECGCVESVDIGAYNTCLNGCQYCYANENQRLVMEKYNQYDINSPLLCGSIMAEDTVKARKVKSFGPLPGGVPV